MSSPVATRRTICFLPPVSSLFPSAFEQQQQIMPLPERSFLPIGPLDTRVEFPAGRHPDLPSIYVMTNHPLQKGSGIAYYFIHDASPSGSLAAYQLEMDIGKVPQGPRKEAIDLGYLELLPGDILFSRLESYSADGLQDVPAVWVTGGQIYSIDLKRESLASRDRALGDRALRSRGHPVKDPKTGRKTGGTEWERKLKTPFDPSRGRCYPFGCTFQKQRSLYSPCAAGKLSTTEPDTIEMRKDLTKSVLEMAALSLKQGPTEVVEHLTLNHELLNTASPGTSDNIAFSHIQFNMACARRYRSKETLADSMGAKFGRTHIDKLDPPAHFTTMNALSDLPPGCDPGRFFIVYPGVFCTLDNFVSVNFSGLRLHGGSPPIAAEGTSEAELAWATRCTLVSYAKEGPNSSNRKMPLTEIEPGSVLSITPEMMSRKPFSIEEKHNSTNFIREGPTVMPPTAFMEFIARCFLVLILAMVSQMAPFLNAKVDSDMFLNSFCYEDSEGRRRRVGIWTNGPGWRDPDSDRPALIDDGSSLVSQDQHLDRQFQKWEEYFNRVAGHIPSAVCCVKNVVPLEGWLPGQPLHKIPHLLAVDDEDDDEREGAKLTFLRPPVRKNKNALASSKSSRNARFGKKPPRKTPPVRGLYPKSGLTPGAGTSSSTPLAATPPTRSKMSGPSNRSLVRPRSVSPPRGASKRLRTDLLSTQAEASVVPSILGEATVRPLSRPRPPNLARDILLSLGLPTTSESPCFEEEAECMDRHSDTTGDDAPGPEYSASEVESTGGGHSDATGYDMPSAGSSGISNVRSPTPTDETSAVLNGAPGPSPIEPPWMFGGTRYLQSRISQDGGWTDGDWTRHLRIYKGLYSGAAAEVGPKPRPAVSSVNSVEDNELTAGELELKYQNDLPYFLRGITSEIVQSELSDLQDDMIAIGSSTCELEPHEVSGVLKDFEIAMTNAPLDPSTLSAVQLTWTGLETLFEDERRTSIHLKQSRASIMAANHAAWRWLRIEVPEIICAILDGSTAAPPWISNLAGLVLSSILHLAQCVKFSAADFGILLAEDHPVTMDFSKMVLPSPEDKEMMAKLVTASAVDIVSEWLDYPKSGPSRWQAAYIDEIVRAVGSEALMLDVVWQKHKKASGHLFRAETTPPICSAKISRRYPLLNKSSRLRADLRELYQTVLDFASGTLFHATLGSDGKISYKSERLSTLMEDRLRSFSRFVLDSFKHVIMGSDIDNVSLQRKLEGNADRYSMFRELAPTRRNMKAVSGPFSPHMVRTIHGVFSALVCRGVTFATPFSREGRTKFYSPVDFTIAIHNCDAVSPESVKDYCDMGAYGQSNFKRNPGLVPKYWEAIEASWPSVFARPGLIPFSDLYNFFYPPLGRRRPFPELGALGSYLLAVDYAYAGVATVPTEMEMGGYIHSLNKGPVSAFEYMGMIDPPPPGKKGARPRPILAQCQRAFKTAHALIQDSIPLEFHLKAGLDVFVTEHALCKFMRCKEEGGF